MIRLLKNFRASEVSNVCCSENEPYIVYKLSEDGKGYELYEPYDESNMTNDSYQDGEYIAIPLRTTGCSVATFERGDIIENVQGSTNDPKPYKQNSWVEVLKYCKIKDVNTCCTDGNFYDLETDDNIGTHAPSYYLGGHIILEKTFNQRVGPNGDVYLLSICNDHNSRILPGRHIGENGLGYYMKVGRHCSGLKLIGYLLQPVVEEAIQAELSVEAAATTDDSKI